MLCEAAANARSRSEGCARRHSMRDQGVKFCVGPHSMRDQRLRKASALASWKKFTGLGTLASHLLFVYTQPIKCNFLRPHPGVPCPACWRRGAAPLSPSEPTKAGGHPSLGFRGASSGRDKTELTRRSWHEHSAGTPADKRASTLDGSRHCCPKRLGL